MQIPNLYDRIAEVAGVSRHDVKKILHLLAYAGEEVTAPPGPEEFILHPGVSFADRSHALSELAGWLFKWSHIAHKEPENKRELVCLNVAQELLDGSISAKRLRGDYLTIFAELTQAREALNEIQNRIAAALNAGGA